MIEYFVKRSLFFSRSRDRLIRLALYRQALLPRLRRLRLMLAWPLWTVVWGWTTASSLMLSGNPRWERTRRFIVSFWRWYFAHRHVTFYLSRDIPAATRGRLILAVRTDVFDSPFLFQALDTQVVIPIPDAFAHFQMIPGVVFPNWKTLFEPTSYRDLGTDNHAKNIRSMLDRGYTVLAYISPIIQHFNHHPRLKIEQEILPLIRDYDDVWLVNHGEFATHSATHFRLPLIVRVRLAPASEVIGREQEPRRVANVLAQWFGFYDAEIIRRKDAPK
ncbi:hypothetical protein EB093_03445 [bacterium]|nr:hypothetical protein [bacterium]